MNINRLVVNNISSSNIPFKYLKPKKLRGTSHIIENSPNSHSYPCSSKELEGIIEGLPENTSSSSDLDIKQMVILMMSEPQDGIGFAKLEGIIEERISPDND